MSIKRLLSSVVRACCRALLCFLIKCSSALRLALISWFINISMIRQFRRGIISLFLSCVPSILPSLPLRSLIKMKLSRPIPLWSLLHFHSPNGSDPQFVSVSIQLAASDSCLLLWCFCLAQSLCSSSLSVSIWSSSPPPDSLPFFFPLLPTPPHF